MLSAWALDFCSLIDRARELMLRGNAFQRRPKLGKWDWTGYGRPFPYNVSP